MTAGSQQNGVTRQTTWEQFWPSQIGSHERTELVAIWEMERS